MPGIDQRRIVSDAVGGRDARRRAVPEVDRVGERGAVRLGVVLDHQRETELVAALPRQRHADDARRVAHEERDPLGRRVLRRHDQVALVLAVLVVDDDHDLAAADGGDRVLDGGEERASLCHDSVLGAFGIGAWASSRRSTYFAITSTSRFTRAPAPLCPSVVTAAVWGITATVNPSSSRLDDGEADAVDGDRALLDDVAEEVGRHATRAGRAPARRSRRRRRRGPARGGRRGDPRGAPAARG